MEKRNLVKSLGDSTYNNKDKIDFSYLVEIILE